MTATENKISALFEELVPMSGKADTVAGEIVRAISRIGYRNWNDGDHIGVGYGRETCNPAARYLMQVCDSEVSDAIDELWGVEEDARYDELLNNLEEKVVAYLEQHPELKSTKNDVDMWSCRTDEDVDDPYEDEEDW